MKTWTYFEPDPDAGNPHKMSQEQIDQDEACWEDVDGRFRDLAPNVQKAIRAIQREDLRRILSNISECESPIEQLLSMHLHRYMEFYDRIGWFDGGRWIVQIQAHVRCDPAGKVYRPDFIIDCMMFGERVALAIECDGHDFHERTKEQAKRDRSKDRELMECGLPVIRFTGSEIHADPEGCAKQGVSMLQTLRRQMGNKSGDAE